MPAVFVVSEERVGLLTDISYILGKEGIRMENVGLEAAGGKTVISIDVRDPQKAKNVLVKNGFEILNRGLLVLRLPEYFRKIEDIKGMLEERRIALHEWRLISEENKEGKGIVALKVDKPRKALKVLCDFTI